MNLFVCSGVVVRHFVINGDRKILKFTVATEKRNGQDRNNVDYVPCVIFNPDEETIGLIQDQAIVEFTGRVKSFKFQVTGETNYRTEVVVNARSLKAL